MFHHHKTIKPSRWPAAFLLSLTITASAIAQTYNVTDLGPVTPYGVNDHGQVVSIDNQIGYIMFGNAIILGSGANNVKALNNNAEVVGSYDTKVIAPDGSSIKHAFRWVTGSPSYVVEDLNHYLPTNSGWVLTAANDINNAGQIVGTGTYTGLDGAVYSGIDFLWELEVDGFAKVTAVPMGPSSNENPSAVNGLLSPQVVGTINAESFVWQASNPTLIPIGHLDIAQTQAFDISDAGQVVGISGNKAFLWTPGATDGPAWNPQMKNLQPTVGFSSSKAFAINNSGQVVGTGVSSTGSYVAFGWDKINGWRDLNKVSAKPANWQLQVARGVNNRLNTSGLPAAQIIASGYITTTTSTKVKGKTTTTTRNVARGFLLTPQ